ncbi:MAG: hypothetical protein ACM3SQ_04685 [Betaproteobacteria bacterium]
MFKRCALLLALAFSVMSLVAPATASAQGRSDQGTYFTFSAPVTLPGVTLPAGRYLFRLVDSRTNRHNVQVLSDDGSKLYVTLMGIPAQRLDATANPELRFMETPATVAPAIKTWWYPGNRVGHEFIYPKDQARRLAEATAESVLTTRPDVSTAEEMKTAELERLSPAGEETPVIVEAAPEPVVPEGTPKTGEVASPTTVLPATPAEAHHEMPGERLPKTAGFMPFVGLIGVMSLFGALALGRLRHGRS